MYHGSTGAILGDVKSVSGSTVGPLTHVRDVMSDAAALAERCRNLANTLAGHDSGVSGASPEDPEPATGGVIPNLQDQATHLSGLIAEANRALGRIDQATS